MREFQLPTPDDAHLHLRDGDALLRTVPDSVRSFGRAVVMPNLKPPVVDVASATAYRDRILAHVPRGQTFEPLMALYLTDLTSPEIVKEAAACEFVVGFKLYPAGATTNSDAGVSDLDALDDTIAAIAEAGLLLLVHGEVTYDDVDIFARERVFLKKVLAPLLTRHPSLRVVLEHVTTEDGVEMVRKNRDRMAGSITPHHLLLNRNALLVGGIHPHYYCLPVLKSEHHRRALVDAAITDDAFFLGTDSAPHALGNKECASGCAGIYNTPCAIEVVAEIFDAHDALAALPAFVSHRFSAFYALDTASEHARLVEKETHIPSELSFGDDVVVPLRAGGSVNWNLERLPVC